LGALQIGKKDGDHFTDEEIARRRDDVIRRMANTPPKPHSEMNVNGGVKAGHWGGAKTGQLAAWASSTTRHGRPGGDGRGFVAGADVAFKRRG
jgi:hypothetical protein